MAILIIVESPTKARTLTRFLGKDYEIEATLGHVRDLPEKKLGVEITKTAKDGKDVFNFKPQYQVIPLRKKRVAELKSFVGIATKVVIATDPDREGEAIAYHVAMICSNSKFKIQNSKLNRIVFHEITEQAIKDALVHPREIDLRLVDAQQARRVLDRLVGYKLSPLLWNKLRKKWLSAGRVQSVTTRLVVEREKEIEKFQKEEFWRIFAKFKAESGILEAELIAKDGINYEETISFDLFDGKYTTAKTSIKDHLVAENIKANIKSPFKVSSVEKKEVKRLPPPPFSTSKLAQDAGRVLYFSSKKTMQIAQKLYEEGLITYHRTDSNNLSDKFLNEAKDYITSVYGETYHAGYLRRFTTKSKVAQEAHEAIRPTNVKVKSEDIKDQSEMNKDHFRLYELIWKRALSSQGAEAIFDSTTIDILSENNYKFETKGSVLKFEGYLKISGRTSEDKIIIDAKEGETVVLEELNKAQNFTFAPPRYTEASLIKALEEKEIGRPSTYAPTLSTIFDRLYVEKVLEMGKRTNKIKPTELGILVTDFLVKYFANIVDLPFTARMEEDLDKVANGEKEWQPVISDFYGPFSQMLDKVYQTVEKVEKIVEEVGENCPECGDLLVYRSGKFGRFIACSNFPKCKFTRNIVEKIDVKCPRCQGDMVVKKSKRGKQFYGCGNYPKCTFAAWKKEEIK